MNDAEKNTEAVWITWEDHRRSRVLAENFSAQYKVIGIKKYRKFRYSVLCFKTLKFLIANRPKVVICQNPSMILNLFLCTMKNMLGFYLVADRHTNFAFRHSRSYKLKWVLYRMVSNITIRHSDLMIVTNPFLKEFVDCMGGRGVVLPDKIPDFQGRLQKKKLQGRLKVFFICTFSDDEPFREVFEAAKLMPSDWIIYVSGNYRKANLQPDYVPQNVVLLGFVEEDDYLIYLSAVDAVMVLTTLDYTLNCGAYEAVALNKPMVLSHKKTIINYFNKGAVYVEPVAQSITEGIESLFKDCETFESEVKELKCELELSWNKQFATIKSKISSLTGNSTGKL